MALPIKVMNAVKWYATKHELIPQLSAYPQMRFRDSHGKEVIVEAFNILTQYQNRAKNKDPR